MRKRLLICMYFVNIINHSLKHNTKCTAITCNNKYTTGSDQMEYVQTHNRLTLYCSFSVVLSSTEIYYNEFCSRQEMDVLMQPVNWF